jgi:hypothetical protein
MSIASNSATFSETDRTWLGTGNMRSNYIHGHFPLSDTPLVFEIFPYPSTLPRSNLRPRQVHFRHSTHKSINFFILDPNTMLQPREPLHSGCNIGSFPSPYFQRGGDIVITSRQVFIYCCNSVYVWDRTSESHDTRWPVSIACNPATFSEPDRTWLGTGNMRLNTVHRHFPLSDSPLMVEIFPYPSTWPCSNLMPGQVRFHCSSHKSGNFSFQPLTQSCSLGKHYVREVTWLSRLPIFRGGGHCHDLKATFRIPLQPGTHLGWNIGKP